MNVHVVAVSADAFLAKIDVLAPAAADKVLFVAHGPADRARFQQLSHDVPGVGPPVVQNLVFLPNFGQIVVT
jgi:hypothetical protein